MRRFGLAGWTVLGLAGLYLIVPLLMTVSFSLWEGHGKYGFDAYRSLLARPGASERHGHQGPERQLPSR